jgi:hypothetical protein
MPPPDVGPLAALTQLPRLGGPPSSCQRFAVARFESVGCGSRQPVLSGSLVLCGYPVLDSPGILAGD